MIWLTAFHLHWNVKSNLVYSTSIHSYLILHLISPWFLLAWAFHLSSFLPVLCSVPMCTLTTWEAKCCLALLLCNRVAYLGLPEIIVPNVPFFRLLSSWNILLVFREWPADTIATVLDSGHKASFGSHLRLTNPPTTLLLHNSQGCAFCISTGR